MSVLLRTSRLLLRAAQQKTEVRHIKRWVAPTMKSLKARRDKIGPDKVAPRSTFLEWNYDAELYAFGKRLNEDFDEKLLRRALTHSSYKSKVAASEQSTFEDNRELIEEGHSFISEYLTNSLGQTYHADITNKLVEYLTSEKMLSHVAIHLGLKDIILTEEFPVESKTLSNTFKAVVAALKLSKGSSQAEVFLKDFLVSQMVDKDVYEIWDPANPYEYLKRILQRDDIEPRLCNQSAARTILANYQVGLYSDKKMLGIGWGETVEIAKDTAALDAIRRFFAKQGSQLKS